MPRVRRRQMRQRVRLTLDGLTGPEEFAFVLGWHPALIVDGYLWPALGPDTWATWGEFFGDYEMVRDELIASYRRDSPHFGPTWEPVAEPLYQAWKRDGTVPAAGAGISGPWKVEYANAEGIG